MKSILVLRALFLGFLVFFHYGSVFAAGIETPTLSPTPTSTPEPTPEPTPTSTPTSMPIANPPSKKKVFENCQIFRDQVIPESVLKNEEVLIIGPSQINQYYALIRVMCKLGAGSEVSSHKVKVDLSGPPPCVADSKSICLAQMSGAKDVTLTPQLTDTQISYLLKSNDLDQSYTLSPKDLKVTFTEIVEDTSSLTLKSVFTPLDLPFHLGGFGGNPSCQLYVSGATSRSGSLKDVSCVGKDCTPTKSLIVENGKLIFQAVITGASGPRAIPKNVSWSGGSGNNKIKSNGTWEAPPVGSDQTVSATVTTKDNMDIYCGIKINQKGQGATLGISKYGDCPYFRAIRNYYFLNKTDDAVQSTAYTIPLKIPGFDVEYGKVKPEIPFLGVMNVAATKSGDINVTNNIVNIPDISNRNYSAAIVVAKTLSLDSMTVGPTIYWGELNPQDYSKTVLSPISETPIDDNKLVVFQFFLAGNEVNGNGIDLRGSQGGTPLYQFKESKGGLPYDRMIPVVNDSCLPLYQVRTPTREDKPLPPVLADAVTCVYSKPFKFSEFRSGRVQLQVMHLVPEFPSHEFPLDLIKGNTGTPVYLTKKTTDVASLYAGTTAEKVRCWKVNPGALGSPSWVNPGALNSGSGVTSKTDVIREKTPGDECSTRLSYTTTDTTHGSIGRLGYRWNMEVMSWGLGFRNKINQTGVGEILSGDTAGFGGIADVWIGEGNFGGTLSEAPGNETKVQTFYVRYWGYDTDSISTDNIAASFKAPMCPGSQFAYDTVSLSWSPLILDVAGEGIKISRTFGRSVGFDIKNQGSISYVDWPENTDQVAFLVLPKGKNKVTSIRELFGDDKFKNGFEKLAQYDSNHDAQIDKSDKIYSKLRLWFDLNRDGKVQDGELKTLDSQGVVSIRLDYAKPGVGTSAEKKTLNGLYFNSQKSQFMNIEDHYFYEYIDSERVKYEKK